MNTTDSEIDNALVKRYVMQRIPFTLTDEIWLQIDSVFEKVWNETLGPGAWFTWDEVGQLVHAELLKRKILLGRERVDEIVNLMLKYIEDTGGFME